MDLCSTDSLPCLHCSCRCFWVKSILNWFPVMRLTSIVRFYSMFICTVKHHEMNLKYQCKSENNNNLGISELIWLSHHEHSLFSSKSIPCPHFWYRIFHLYFIHRLLFWRVQGGPWLSPWVSWHRLQPPPTTTPVTPMGIERKKMDGSCFLAS